MKTIVYLATLLVLAIQVMAQDQTPANQSKQSIKPVLGGSLKKATSTDASSQQIAAIEKEKNNSHVDHFFDVIQKANQDNEQVQVALTKEEQFKVQRILELKQIQASELSFNTTLKKFENNKNIINAMLVKGTFAAEISGRAGDLEFEAERDIRIAKEIREEANAQPNVPAHLGGLGNAEEKEFIALLKQDEALVLLEKNHRPVFKNNADVLIGFNMKNTK